MSEADLQSLFPSDRFELIATGSSYIYTKNLLPSGEFITVPALWALLRRRPG